MAKDTEVDQFQRTVKSFFYVAFTTNILWATKEGKDKGKDKGKGKGKDKGKDKGKGFSI